MLVRSIDVGSEILDEFHDLCECCICEVYGKFFLIKIIVKFVFSKIIVRLRLFLNFVEM